MKNFAQLKLIASFCFCLLMTFTLQAEEEIPSAACATTQVTLLVTKCRTPGAKCGRNDSGVCTTLTKTAGIIKYTDCFCVKSATGEQVNLLEQEGEEEAIENTVVAAGVSTTSRSWILLGILVLLGLSFHYSNRKETSTL